MVVLRIASLRIKTTLLVLAVLNGLLPIQASAEGLDVPLQYTLSEDSPLVESVADLSRREKHFAAILQFYRQQSPHTISDKLAAAKSAWALGLVDLARQQWDSVLADREFQGAERSRAELARAILEVQEQDYERSRSLAERAARRLDASDLRAQFWLVIGESLTASGNVSRAEGYYQKAFEESTEPLRSEAAYLLGEVQMKLGMASEARYSYTSIEASSPYAPQGLRRLAEIDLLQRNFDGVLTWIREGKNAYPHFFEDAWSTYALISSLVEVKRLDSARKELKQFAKRFGASNSWYALAQASVEGAEFYEMYSRARLSGTEEAE